MNERVRTFARRLIEIHGGNLSSAAVAIEQSQSWLHRFVNGDMGGSVESASKIARELGISINEILNIEDDAPSHTLRMCSELPNYQVALFSARRVAGNRFTEKVWERVGRSVLSFPPEQLEALDLIAVATMLETFGRKRTSGSDTSPPSVRSAGSTRRSSRKIRSKP